MADSFPLILPSATSWFCRSLLGRQNPDTKCQWAQMAQSGADLTAWSKAEQNIA